MLWIALVAAGVASPALDNESIDIRALPTLVVQWERSGTSVQDVVVDDGVAYARAWRDLEAIEIASGQTLWKLSLDHRIARGPVLLDDRLAVIVDERTLVLVDRLSGVVTATRPLRGKPYHGSALAGPPLVAVIQHGDDDGIELLRLDDVNGHELDRLPIDNLASLHSFQGTTMVSFESEGRPRLIGIRRGDLTPAWEHPIVAWNLFERGDRVIAEIEETAAAYVTLDPRDGTLETALPERPRRTVEEGAWRLAWDLEVVGHRPPTRLRRLDPRSGQPVWERRLPCSPAVWTRDDHRLVLDCRSADGGRSQLLVIELETGEILHRATGFHGVSTLSIVDDLGLAASSDGLFAFSVTLEGPAIAETMSLEYEVDALLAAARQHWVTADQIAADLRRIGDAALPILTRRLLELDQLTAAAATSVLGDAAYSPAASAVAERLRDLPALGSSEKCGEHQRMLTRNLKLALIRALGRIGGDGVASLVGSISTDPAEPNHVRQQAAFALAEMGTAEALEWLDRAPTRTQRARWWRPPSADAWLAVLTSSSPLEGAQKYGGTSPWQRRDQATLATGEDRTIVVFPDPAAGNRNDLWAAVVDADGSPETPVLLGVSLEDLGSTWEPPTLAGSIDKGQLVLMASPGEHTATVDLVAVQRDQDEDGLTDLLERRLGTDVERADADDDGIPDPEDLVPQAAPATSLDDEEKIALAVMDSFFRYDNQWRDGVAFVEADRSLPWSGRTGPSFTVTPERVDELRRGLASWLPPIFGVHRAGPDEVDEESLEYLDLEDGDRLYIISAPQEGHFAIVRRVGDRWVVREIRMWWIA